MQTIENSLEMSRSNRSVVSLGQKQVTNRVASLHHSNVLNGAHVTDGNTLFLVFIEREKIFLKKKKKKR